MNRIIKRKIKKLTTPAILFPALSLAATIVLNIISFHLTNPSSPVYIGNLRNALNVIQKEDIENRIKKIKSGLQQTFKNEQSFKIGGATILNDMASIEYYIKGQDHLSRYIDIFLQNTCIYHYAVTEPTEIIFHTNKQECYVIFKQICGNGGYLRYNISRVYENGFLEEIDEYSSKISGSDIQAFGDKIFLNEGGISELIIANSTVVKKRISEQGNKTTIGMNRIKVKKRGGTGCEISITDGFSENTYIKNNLDKIEIEISQYDLLAFDVENSGGFFCKISHSASDGIQDYANGYMLTRVGTCSFRLEMSHSVVFMSIRVIKRPY